MKKVLLTGAAGFIASQVAHQLLAQGVEVVAIDNMNDYYDVRLKQHRLELLKKNPTFHFYQIDIEKSENLRQIFLQNQFDVVFNLAARAGVRYSMQNPHVYMSTNAQGTLHILELMREFSCGKLVLASTSSLYAGQVMPFTEDLPVNTPISPYAASKKAAEMMAYTYHHLYGIDVSILRYFTVYGPAGRPDMGIFRFTEWIQRGQPLEIFGDGAQSRDFTYVADIARGTILAAKKLGYEVINLGGGQNPITLSRVIEGLEKRLGRQAQKLYNDFHSADVKETWADISKAKKLLNWQPQVSFEQGLDQTVQWHVQNNNWLKTIQL